MMERLGEIRFPSRGIDSSNEVSGPPPLTTPVGVNVRVFEPSTGRGRGGSRPGLRKLVDQQVPTQGAGP